MLYNIDIAMFKIILCTIYLESDGKESACNAGDPGSIPGSGRSLAEGNGHSLQYSFLGNPTDSGVWWATVHGVAKSQTGPSDKHFITIYDICKNISMNMY